MNHCSRIKTSSLAFCFVEAHTTKNMLRKKRTYFKFREEKLTKVTPMMLSMIICSLITIKNMIREQRDISQFDFWWLSLPSSAKVNWFKVEAQEETQFVRNFRVSRKYWVPRCTGDGFSRMFGLFINLKLSVTFFINFPLVKHDLSDSVGSLISYVTRLNFES